jgi:hypothetical protein
MTEAERSKRTPQKNDALRSRFGERAFAKRTVLRRLNLKLRTIGYWPETEEKTLQRMHELRNSVR